MPDFVKASQCHLIPWMKGNHSIVRDAVETPDKVTILNFENVNLCAKFAPATYKNTYPVRIHSRCSLHFYTYCQINLATGGLLSN